MARVAKKKTATKKRSTATKRAPAKRAATKKKVAPRRKKTSASSVAKMASDLKKQVDRIEKHAAKKAGSRTRSIFFITMQPKSGGVKYFDGSKFVAGASEAASWTSKESAARVARLIANRLVQPVGVYTKKK